MNRARFARLLLILPIAALATTCGSVSGDQAVALDRALVQALDWDVDHPDDRLLHADHDERLAAVRWLGQSGESHAIGYLARALDDTDLRVRRDAATGLAAFGPALDDEAIAALAGALGDPYAIVRDRAVSALIASGRGDAVAALRVRLRRAPEAEADPLIAALGAMGDASAAADVARFLPSADPYLRLRAADALVAFGESSVPWVTPALDSDVPAIRCDAALTLARLGDAGRGAVRDHEPPSDPLGRVCRSASATDGVEVLRSAAITADLDIRDAALRGLAAVGDRDAADALVRLLPKLHTDDDNPALRALATMPSLAAASLRSALPEASGLQAVRLAEALAAVGTADDRERINALLVGAPHPHRPALLAALETLEWRTSR